MKELKISMPFDCKLIEPLFTAPCHTQSDIACSTSSKWRKGILIKTFTISKTNLHEVSFL